LKFFENNLLFEDIFENQFLNIKEFFFYFQNQSENLDEYKFLLTYCDNWNIENGLIENIFQ
jgi:hypothetical protein